MKKLLLSILTVTSFAAFAQKDISISLIAPAEGLEINSGKAFSVAFTIKNVGTEAITTSDSFRIVPFIYTQSGAQPITTLAGARALAPGDSVNLAPTGGGYSLTFASDIEQALFCVTIAFNDTTLDVNDSNDVSCNAVSLKVNPTAVSEIDAIAASVKAFPNPANSYFSLTMKSTNATVEIMDITGKLVETTPVSMGEARLDVSNYKNGVYFYQVKNADNTLVKSGKFSVSH